MRLALPDITPLEVWDLPVGGRPLQAWRHTAAFPARLASAIDELRRVHGFAHVHLTGGGADDALAERVRATRERDPFAAARAAAAQRGGALGVDLGQTSIKLAHGERVWRIARDLARAPLRDATPLGERDAARASTIAFLREALASDAERVVLGLPCELDANGHPRSCSYCFRDPDPELVPALVDHSIEKRSVEVANDAELAALAARADPRVPRDATVLVVTIGFGVGAALLRPR